MVWTEGHPRPHQQGPSWSASAGRVPQSRFPAEATGCHRARLRMPGVRPAPDAGHRGSCPSGQPRETRKGAGGHLCHPAPLMGS